MPARPGDLRLAATKEGGVTHGLYFAVMIVTTVLPAEHMVYIYRRGSYDK